MKSISDWVNAQPSWVRGMLAANWIMLIAAVGYTKIMEQDLLALPLTLGVLAVCCLLLGPLVGVFLTTEFAVFRNVPPAGIFLWEKPEAQSAALTA